MVTAVVGAIKFVGGLLVANTFAGFVARVAFTVLLSVVAQKLFGPRASPAAGLSGIQLTTRGALEYRKRIYGEAMVSGPIVYQNLSGTDNEDMWSVVAMCDGESESVVSVWLDGDEIPVADINWTPGTGSGSGTGDGVVSTSRWVGENSENAVRVYWYLGFDDQPVEANLDTAFSDIDTNFRLRGVTHCVYRIRYNADTEEVWREGQPQNYKALIKGSQVYDPRLDSTNGGSGSHRYTDASTWEWSDNSALCVIDYLMTEVEADPATSIDWPAVASAADDCDVLVDVPPAASPQTQEKRFTCNGSLSLGTDHTENLLNLLSSMDGKLSYTSGVWKIRASVWEASSVSLTEDNFLSIGVRGQAPGDERFNTVRGFFIDPSRDYQPVEFPHRTDSSYVTRDDGEDLYFDLELPFSNNEHLAQRIALRTLEQGDKQEFIDGKIDWIGAQIEIGDVVDVTIAELSYSAKTFRVVGWQPLEDDTYNVTLREDSSDAYDDPDVGDYDGVTIDTPTVPTVVVPAPTNLQAAGVNGGIYVTWENPPAATYDVIDVYESGDNDWDNRQLVSSRRSTSVTLNHDSGTQKYYWVQARKNSGELSLREPDSDTSTITATVPGSGGATFGSLANRTVTDVSLDPADSSAQWKLDNDGFIYTDNGSGFVQREQWIGDGAAGDYEMMADNDTGDALEAGTLDTWQLCSTDRTYTQTLTSVGLESTNFRVRVRRTSDDLVGLTASITLVAIVDA